MECVIGQIRIINTPCLFYPTGHVSPDDFAANQPNSREDGAPDGVDGRRLGLPEENNESFFFVSALGKSSGNWVYACWAVGI